MKIKEVMKMRGITQEDLAQKMGINRVSVSRLLSNNNDMRLSTLQKFADAIGCNIEDFFTESPADTSGFASFIRYKGIHYTADSLPEFFRQVDELRAMTGQDD